MASVTLSSMRRFFSAEMTPSISLICTKGMWIVPSFESLPLKAGIPRRLGKGDIYKGPLDPPLKGRDCAGHAFVFYALKITTDHSARIGLQELAQHKEADC